MVENGQVSFATEISLHQIGSNKTMSQCGLEIMDHYSKIRGLLCVAIHRKTFSTSFTCMSYSSLVENMLYMSIIFV